MFSDLHQMSSIAVSIKQQHMSRSRYTTASDSCYVTSGNRVTVRLIEQSSLRSSNVRPIEGSTENSNDRPSDRWASAWRVLAFTQLNVICVISVIHEIHNVIDVGARVSYRAASHAADLAIEGACEGVGEQANKRAIDRTSKRGTDRAFDWAIG